ncbi:MAG: hypothetical protein KKA60_00390 [Proteobacteria bacterium]|nr:hypothetical protein [Pseudomonadota bacterium]
MAHLDSFSHLPIEWDLSPEEAVTLYLEWGNNNWRGAHPPVRGPEDHSYYFVVDNWEDTPRAILLYRNHDRSDELWSMPLPADQARAFRAEFGSLKGVFAPTLEVRQWLQEEIGN